MSTHIIFCCFFLSSLCSFVYLKYSYPKLPMPHPHTLEPTKCYASETLRPRESRTSNSSLVRSTRGSCRTREWECSLGSRSRLLLTRNQKLLLVSLLSSTILLPRPFSNPFLFGFVSHESPSVHHVSLRRRAMVGGIGREYWLQFEEDDSVCVIIVF